MLLCVHIYIMHNTLYILHITGKLCQVYWEGDHTWFVGRILNYSTTRQQHFIYYIDDMTAEWINIQVEPIIIAYEMCLVRSWPALHYTIPLNNITTQNFLRHKKTYSKNSEYIEYLSHNEIRDYEFIPKNQIYPYIFPEISQCIDDGT